MKPLRVAFILVFANLFTIVPAFAQDKPKPEPDKYTYLTAEKLSDGDQQALIGARKAVWEAWFKGDEAKIKELMPAEAIVADPHDAAWGDRDAIIQRSKDFAQTGGQLTELRFPANRIQVYGEVVILYIDYSLTFEVDGSPSQLSGRGTEVFRKHNGHWLNTAWHLDDAQ